MREGYCSCLVCVCVSLVTIDYTHTHAHDHAHTIRRPPAPVGPSHVRTRWYGRACIYIYSMCYVCTYSFTPAPTTAPPHPPSSHCHIVTHTTLVTQVHSVAVDPTPQVRYNVRTPCGPLPTQQGGCVCGLQCLSCHTHTIRRPVGPSHVRTRWYGSACIMLVCVHTN